MTLPLPSSMVASNNRNGNHANAKGSCNRRATSSAWGSVTTPVSMRGIPFFPKMTGMTDMAVMRGVMCTTPMSMTSSIGNYFSPRLSLGDVAQGQVREQKRSTTQPQRPTLRNDVSGISAISCVSGISNVGISNVGGWSTSSNSSSSSHFIFPNAPYLPNLTTTSSSTVGTRSSSLTSNHNFASGGNSMNISSSSAGSRNSRNSRHSRHSRNSRGSNNINNHDDDDHDEEVGILMKQLDCSQARRFATNTALNVIAEKNQT